ncbi:MAG: LysM peptidoglycan-binding domain-containing protein [Myxococcota bacterium]|jgi:LysM repeat protein|nr:LysM peptidoglycan-binding domain-containing protein [Myxococcota bacterium]
MILRRSPLFLRLAALLVIALFCCLRPLQAEAARPAESKSKKKAAQNLEERAPQHYVIQAGDTLLSIAAAHDLTLSELLEVNGIENPDKVPAGQTLLIPKQSKWGRITKQGVIIEVPKGFTLNRIASAYEVKVRDVLRANKLENANKLRQGQKLLIPGATAAIELVPPPPCYKPKVTLYRVRTDESESLPLCFCDGRPTPAAIEAVSRLSSAPGAPAFLLSGRLVELLQKVAEQFPEQRLELISGYRSSKQKESESRHTTGDAIDFRLPGVPYKTLSEALRRFEHVGVGFYPNSVFVHLDIRETSAYWIDYSRPGEKAIYGSSDMTQDEIASIRDRRRLPIEAQLSAIAQDAAAAIAHTIESATSDLEQPEQGTKEEKPASSEEAEPRPSQGS